MSRSVEFFATRQDSLQLLQTLEESSPLFYVRWGHYAEPQAPTYSTASEIPDLGVPSRPRKSEDRYLVFPEQVPVRFRELTGSTGTPEFITEAPAGVPWVHWHSGGLYGKECLVEGIIETALSNPHELRLFDSFYRAIRKRFLRIESSKMGTSYVGMEALELLRGRMRFVRNSNSSPRILDFKLPRGWRPT